MPKVTFVHSDTRREEVEAVDGDSVMRTAVAAAIKGIHGDCGGGLSCATCHVYVDEDCMPLLPELTSTEQDLLEAVAAEPTPFSRLCCQITMTSKLDGLVVHVPDAQ